MSIEISEPLSQGAAISILSALGPTFIATVVSATIAYFARRAEHQKFLLDTLGHFTGGTQNRSVGLGVIEGNLEFFSRKFARTIIPVLVNQFAYLTIQKPAKEKHEIVNRARIEHILSELKKRNYSVFTEDQIALLEECKASRV